jgi:membrane dipeptidase
MKEYGLMPGGERGTYFQTVPFKSWSNFDLPVRLELVSVRRLSYRAGRTRDFVPVAGTGSGLARGRLAFAGYGIVQDQPPWNDFAGLDAKGKILILLPDAPRTWDQEAKRSWTLERKVKLALDKGAVGLIEMDLAEPGQPPIARSAPATLGPGVCPPGFVVLRAGRNFLDDAFYASRASWRDGVSKILRLSEPRSEVLEATVEIEAHYIREERSAPNVLGVLPGNDPQLKSEGIVMGGHLDHLGVGLDGFVYPGADDNATSVGVTLETARALVASGFKPARTIVFAAWAGEEQGTVGSRYYAEHPFLPLDKTVLYLNIDMVGTGDTDLYVGGMYEYGRLFEIVKAGLDPGMIQKLRYRLNYRGSDHTSFWNKGVASISLRTGNILTRGLEDEHPEYHYPGDRAETIDPSLLGLAAQYHCEILTNLADNRSDLLDPAFRAEFVHKDAFVADLHCDTISRFMAGEDLTKDLPQGHIDIPKLKRGAVDLEVFACYVPVPQNEMEKKQAAHKAIGQIESVHRLAAENPDDLEVVLTAADVQRLRNTGKTALLIGIEGGYAIENDLSLLQAFYRQGVRLMTLTHWNRTDWADASGDASPELGGLTEFGEKVVRDMNRLGMIIDVSHAHDETFWDVLRVSTAPIVASHSCCRALSEHHRNMSDDMLKALAKNGGVIGINFYPGFLNAEVDKRQTALLAEVAAKQGLPTTYQELQKVDAARRDAVLNEYKARAVELKLPQVDVKTLVDHIDHVVKVMGSTDYVGLGSDFDGISETPLGLENIGLMPQITAELLARGYKENEVRNILGGSFLRVFQAVEKAAGPKK